MLKSENILHFIGLILIYNIYLLLLLIKSYTKTIDYGSFASIPHMRAIARAVAALRIALNMIIFELARARRISISTTPRTWQWQCFSPRRTFSLFVRPCVCVHMCAQKYVLCVARRPHAHAVMVLYAIRVRAHTFCRLCRRKG